MWTPLLFSFLGDYCLIGGIMRWLKESEIKTFLLGRNYDVRVSGNARWIDQKCTADVLAIVADCIDVFTQQNPGVEFSTKQIWHSEYTIKNVEGIFKKPQVTSTKAKNEYDKFFQQPMELLAYAGVLQKQKLKGKNIYSVLNADVLSYIALRERNALTFLQDYIQRVLDDSDLLVVFEDFFQDQTNSTYNSVKTAFEKFTLSNTRIKNIVECRRIFIKVINPLAYLYNSKGTESGRLSKFKITYDMLMYNRDNFRDVGAQKPKDVTRRAHLEARGTRPSAGMAAYLSQKAKRVVREFNDKYRAGKSEVADMNHLGDQAIHIHHIFPESEFSSIAGFYENLIALTPTQHLSYAHPNGFTQRIDSEYQRICLLAKVNEIEKTLNDQGRDQIYEFRRFIQVLVVGFRDETFEAVLDRDFNSLVEKINSVYQPQSI
jgi:hypothetical protein